MLTHRPRWWQSNAAVSAGVLLLIAALLAVVLVFRDWDDRRRAGILADELQRRGLVPVEARK